MDQIDKKILTILQGNATIPLSELSKRIGISSTPCWNRIKKMEENGTIISKNAILNKEKINLPVKVFLSVSVSSHSKEWLSKFTDTLNKFDQIIEAYRITGSVGDYLLIVVAPSINEYDKFQQSLIKEIEFTKMSSSIGLRELKKNNSLPLDFI